MVVTSLTHRIPPIPRHSLRYAMLIPSSFKLYGEDQRKPEVVVLRKGKEPVRDTTRLSVSAVPSRSYHPAPPTLHTSYSSYRPVVLRHHFLPHHIPHLCIFSLRYTSLPPALESRELERHGSGYDGSGNLTDWHEGRIMR